MPTDSEPVPALRAPVAGGRSVRSVHKRAAAAAGVASVAALMAVVPAGCGATGPGATPVRAAAAGAATAASQGVAPGAAPAVGSVEAGPAGASAPAGPAAGGSVDLSGAATGPTSVGPPPDRVEIPSIGVDAAVIPLGQNPDGSAVVPTDTGVVGWYDKGPLPGGVGPAVLLGHVDSRTGPAVFFRLQHLGAGALVTVDEGGAAVDFAVQDVQRFAKAAFPTAQVFGPTPDRALRIVTCGGEFDRSTGHYTDNVVVFAIAV